MKVLVTGGAGFIGSNFVRLLVEERPDWEVCVLDLLTYAGNIESINDLISESKISFEKADIANSDEMERVFNKFKPELVFHFAAESHVDRSIHSASEFVRTNVVGTQNLINCARNSSIKRFIHVSTDEVYGSLGAEGVFYESTPLDPTSPYASSKAASDLMVLAACKTHGFDAVLTRCTNNYGPYQFPEKLIPLFIANALEDKKLPLYGDGMNVRSWIYVKDHCEAVLLVAEKGISGEVYNIGSTSEGELTNKHVTEVILKSLDKPDSLVQYVEDRLAHDLRYAVSIDKISNELGWQPKIGFDEGISLTIDWYLNNKDWWERIRSGEYIEFYEKHYQKSLAS
ncbi:UNVERIFIED_CONTAM: hypothetical protein GTU68_042590 [Idotea baltica]|nr:hypothetical protein [Idotea baltica]